MNDGTPLDDMKVESAEQGKDSKTRKLLFWIIALWALTLVILIGVAWKAYFDERDKAQTLAEQIAHACESGEFGETVSKEYKNRLCRNAQRVIKNKKLKSGEVQESETQDPEIQDPENQNREEQEREAQEREAQERERQDQEEQDAEQQDSENQDPEVDDPEIQDPEIDDPDPNDPDPPDDDVTGGNCTFSGTGVISFTLQTDSGPITFECVGTGTP